MANFDQLKQSVAALIRTNGAEEITGQIMQDVLLTIINSISGGYMFGGVAQHNGNVGNPDYNVFYLAGSGSYTGYGGAITIEDGCYGVFRYNGSWTQEVVDIGVRLSGSIAQGETRGVTGDVINTALQQLFNNIMNILDTLTFTYNTPSAQQATKAMLDVIMTPTGGASHVFATLTLASATVAAAGLMSAEDKQKVDRMLTDFRSLSLTDTTAAADQATKIVQTLSATLGENPEAITTFTILAATASKAGLMSAADKAVLDCLVAMVGYYECSTAAGTAAKEVSALGYSLTSGGCIRIKMNNANTANNVTLNINSTGAKALYYDGEQASATNTWEAGDVLEVYYDGTQYQCASDEKIKIGDTSDADLEISDPNGNVLLRLEDGNIKTKNFNSDTDAPISGDISDADLEFSDPNGNVLLRLKDGNIETKNFNSDTDAPISEDTSDADLEISDPNGNVLLRLEDGNIETKNFNSAKKELDGYKYSIIGDSISTFQGYLPSGYAYFYPKPALSNVSQTWWKRMEVFTGLSLLKNCSWSNSEMCGDSESLDNAIAGCSTARINDVSDNGINPDIIIVYIGINDMARNTLGSWDASMTIPNEGIITDFSSAYALAIKKIMVKYPAAEVYCCSLLECPNADYSSTEFPCINSHGESLVEYNNAIKKISLGIGAKFIDVHECGITYWNGPNDNFLDNTHPNAKGAYILGKYIANSILNQTLLKL